jgi:DNA-directed RNA polymerase subunit RPC12/RpoP
MGWGEAMFCCHVLQRWIESAGERDFSVIVSRDEGKFIFDLQFRAISVEDEGGLEVGEVQVPAHSCMTLACSGRIYYCAFCGRQLDSLINPSTRDAFTQIADNHQRFVMDVRFREARRKSPRITQGLRHRAYVVILCYILSIIVVLSVQPKNPVVYILLLTMLFGGFLALMRCPHCSHLIFRKKSELFGISYWGGLPPEKCPRCGSSF